MSRRITLKDSYFRVIGSVDVKDNGDKVLKDKYFHVKGYYYASQDVTKDEYFHVVAHGDILTSLL